MPENFSADPLQTLHNNIIIRDKTDDLRFTDSM